MRSREGKTNRRWSVTAKTRQILLHFEPVSPSGSQNQGIVYTTLACTHGTNWKHCAVPPNYDDARKFAYRG